jgi:transposase
VYFKTSGRFNPEKGRDDLYYRLVESYRNADGRPCHRTILNIGFIADDYTTEQLNEVTRFLNDRYRHAQSMVEPADPKVCAFAQSLWQRIVAGKRVDLGLFHPASRHIDADTMRHSNVREIGAEAICQQAFRELGIDQVLARAGFNEAQQQLAATQIISRAVYPASELKTASWIRDNSAVCELTGFDRETITKDKLYQSAIDLYEVRDQLEEHLSVRTNELFDISDQIMLYDLTNTYFEGKYSRSALARFGRSKEKRNDARLVVLALVVNVFGFIKYSGIFEGNMSDSRNVDKMLDKLSRRSGAKNPVVVIDAGIATEENLELIRSRGYHYLCVSRSRLKDYEAVSDRLTVLLETRSKREVKLRAVRSESATDYYLEVHSQDKLSTASGMCAQFEQRFETALSAIAASLHRKGGVKRPDKVHERIGRAKERYPSVQYYYDIEVECSDDGKTVRAISWSKNTAKAGEKQASLGIYFLRTSLPMTDEVVMWNIYNTIREIESSFRTLKTDLDLRPVYRKSDTGTLAHLHLGILAYWLVNTVRCKLKRHGIRSHWPEIVRIGNTQKMITTHGTNAAGVLIGVRKCSEPCSELKRLQDILKLPPRPFSRRKSVVHKPEPKKPELINSQNIPPG